MRVIVTRPEHEAAEWVASLAAAGLDAVALPLIGIAPVPDSGPARAAWARMADFAAAMFVSGNAVREFIRLRPAGAPLPARAWAPGPGTRHALLAAGLGAAAIDSPPVEHAQFDSEALWEVVAPQVRAGTRVLVVRGGDIAGHGQGRTWLAEQVEARGGVVDAVVAYTRGLPPWTAMQAAQAVQAAADGSTWLLSSSEGIANLATLLPGQDWSQARALATHPRIAAAARRAGFGSVQACAPQLDAVVRALESAGQ